MSLTLTYHRNAVKFLFKQDVRNRQRIYGGWEGLKHPFGDMPNLKAPRLRVDTFRIIYQNNIQEQVIYILAIDNRCDIY